MTDDILAVYDHGDGTADRYTIVLNWPDYGAGSEQTEYAALGLSTDCDSSQGISQWGNAILGPHLGKEVNIDDLPENVRRHALARTERG